MKAAVLHAKNDLRYEEIKTPEIEKDEVLINVKFSGICGSDVPRVLGDAAHFYPIVLGHEFSGRVVKIGENVKNVKIGDRVTGAPLLPCHKCKECLSGKYSLCKNYGFIGSRQQGSFAEYVKLPKRNVVILGDIPYEQGVFFEPASVALHGLRRLNYKKGGRVAILGAGTIGLFVMQWAKIFGAKDICVFDIDEGRLNLAKEFGANKTINLLNEKWEDYSGDILKEGGFDYVYEAAGKKQTIGLSFDLAGNSAEICFIGTTSEKLEFSGEQFQQINRKELMVTGSWMSYGIPFPGDEWGITAHFFSTGQLKFSDKLILKKFPLSRAKEAFELFKNPNGVGGKILLKNDNFGE